MTSGLDIRSDLGQTRTVDRGTSDNDGIRAGLPGHAAHSFTHQAFGTVAADCITDTAGRDRREPKFRTFSRSDVHNDCAVGTTPAMAKHLTDQ